MTEYDHYLFDLNGYIVVEGALSPELVGGMNEAIDQHRDRINIRTPEQALDGSLKEQGGRAAEGLKGTHGRGDFGGYLFWEQPWRQPFLDAIALPYIMRAMLATIGPRFRLVGNGGMTMTKGSEGFMLHGGGTPELEHMREVFYHRFEFGRMSNGLMSVSFALSDQGPEDGGFVCIPGSHKANYLCPRDVRRLEMDLGCIKHFSLKAGDAVIFTEALTHGTVPWKADFERRLLRYLYAPALHTGTAGNFEEIDNELTPLQRVVVQPPYSYQQDTDIAAMLEDQ
jgi:ectoine hydroxylase-related dioxygenase (phytanoyl-CoA dioxygenase family)